MRIASILFHRNRCGAKRLAPNNFCCWSILPRGRVRQGKIFLWKACQAIGSILESSSQSIRMLFINLCCILAMAELLQRIMLFIQWVHLCCYICWFLNNIYSKINHYQSWYLSCKFYFQIVFKAIEVIAFWMTKFGGECCSMLSYLLYVALWKNNKRGWFSIMNQLFYYYIRV